MNALLYSLSQPSYGAARALRNLTFAFLALWLAAFPANARQLTVVALGDSLTAGYGLAPDQGYVPQLQAWLQDRGQDVKVENAGVSGDTTAGGLSRLDWSLTPETDALIVNLGGNDMLRGIPPEEAMANLDRILAGARDRGLPVLLVGLHAPGNWGPDYKTAFDAIFPTLAARYGVLLYPDYFAPLKATGNDNQALQDYMQPDAIHPNAAGVARIVQAIGPTVLTLLQKAAP
jgi:acyl-CoA thioesterase I